MKQFFPLLTIATIFLFCSLLQLPEAALATPLYKIVDKRGNITFSSRKPKAGKKYQLFHASRSSFSKIYTAKGRKWRFFPQDSVFDSDIIRVAKKNSISPALVKAVIHIESGFKPKALSPKGAQGLMQLMPTTARLLGVKNAFEPRQNMEAGSKHLKTLLDKYDGKLDLVLAAYNAGETAVNKHAGIPPYLETRNYVTRVKRAYHSYLENFY
jgi:soluble lytic murein transglycosylase-like protein